MYFKYEKGFINLSYSILQIKSAKMKALFVFLNYLQILFSKSIQLSLEIFRCNLITGCLVIRLDLLKNNSAMISFVPVFLNLLYKNLKEVYTR